MFMRARNDVRFPTNLGRSVLAPKAFVYAFTT